MADQKDVDSAKATVDQLQSQVDEMNKKLEGGKADTALDAVANVLGDFKHKIVNKKMLKVEGGYTKIQVGQSNQIVLGAKGEYVNPYSISIILGMETKLVLGASNTEIDGAKSDTIIGAKVDLLAGIKYEQKAATTKVFGGAPKLQKQGTLLNLMDTFNQKVGNMVQKYTKALYKAAQVQEDIGTLAAKIDDLTRKCDSAKQSIGSMSLKVGPYKMKGDTMTFSYSSIGITAGGGFKATGGGAYIHMDPSCYINAGGGAMGCYSDCVMFRGATYRFV